MHQHVTEFCQCRLLVLTIHRRAGIDHVAQRGMVVAIDGGVFDHHLEDGRHREHVADAMLLDQPEGFVDVKAFRWKQDGFCATRGLHELMDARAMRQGCDHQRSVVLGGAGHEISKVICHHKGHLAVGQHRRLGTPGGARGEEEPAGIVVLDAGVIDAGARMRGDRLADGFLAERTLPDPPDKGERRARGFDGCGMLGKIAVTQKCFRARGGREIGDLVRHQPKIGRHPDRAQTKGRKHRPEHLVAIFRVHQDAVALGDAPRGQGCRQCRDTGVDLAPGPGFFGPDEADAVAMPARVLGRKMRKVHHPARHPRHAASAGCCALAAHRRPIHAPAASSTTPTTPATMPCL